jgi:hypothetical protein
MNIYIYIYAYQLFLFLDLRNGKQLIETLAFEKFLHRNVTLNYPEISFQMYNYLTNIGRL